MKKLYLLTLLFFGLTTQAQLIIDNTTQTPAQLVQNVLVGNGVTPTNIKFNGSTANANVVRDQVAKFSTNFNPTNLGLDAGVLLTTGNAQVANGPNNAANTTVPTATPLLGDADLAMLSGQAIRNVAVLEFDFVATGPNLHFDFTFASEEYPEFVGTTFNDVFGFFLSGPGVSGPYINGAANIALVPSTSTAVAINTVNNGLNNSGSCTNCTYYYNNTGIGNNPTTWNPAFTTQYDGFTKNLSANAQLLCGQTYHIKLAIGNASDNLFDSAVFLKDFAIPPLVLTDISGADEILGCQEDTVIYSGIPAGTNVFVWTFNGVVIPTATGPNLTVNESGTYGLTVYNSVGCLLAQDDIIVNFATVDVLNPQNITICDAVAPMHTFNINQNVYMLDGNNASDYTFTYYVDAAGVPGAQIPNGNLGAYSSPGLGEIIWVAALDETINGCLKIKPFTLNVVASPSGTFSYTGSPYCSDDATSHLPTLSGLTTGGTYSYAVTPPGPGTLILDATTGAITPLGSTFNTTYIVSYDIPASATCPAYHTEALPITINFCVTCTTTASNSGPICSGDNFNLFATNAGAGATYAWTGPNGFTSTDQNPVGVPSPTGAAPYVYTVVATIGGIPCSTATTTVVLNPIITPAFTAVAAICSGGTLSALPTTSNNGITGSWAPALDNTTTTTYTFTPTAGQCATIQTMSITVTPNVTPTFTAVAAICSGATLSALPTTSIEGITGTWAPALNNTATTTYTFTPTAGQCAVTQTMSITVTPNATPTFTPVAAICSGAALAPLPTTSIEGITGTWAPALNNTATTTYTFTPTAGICAVTQTMSITVNPITTPTFTPVAAICSGGTLSALPTTSIEGITGSWAPALNNTATTTYTFTPTAGQCAVTQTMSITVTPNVTPTFTAVAAICSGATLSALPTTSIEGITGTWAPALNNTATTTYTFTPTAGQCAVTQTMSITVTPNATPTFTPVAAICSGAALAPLPTTSIEGITGTWAPALNNTATTTYTFTPTAGICAVTQTMSITVNPIITPTFTPVAAICSGGTLAPLPTTSIEGITGTWAPALNNTATTTYTFTPTAGQCAVTQTMSITVTPNVTPTFTQVATICSGATLSALPTASIEGITGTWAPALNNTATTTYTFTPTAGQCAVTQTMSITVTPNATPTFTPVAAICSGAALAPLPTTSTNGITGTWAPALNNTATTTYTFTPTAGICAVTQTMSITVNSNVTPTFTQVAAICSGAALAPLPTTSTNGITGTWAPALNNTATTMYTFTPTAGQCAVTQTMSITVNPIITPTFTQVATICSGGSLSALPTTSIEGITGTWSPALNNTLTTTYTFTPTAGQCAVTQTMTITVTPNVTPTFTQVAAICVGAALAPLPTTSNNGITGTWSPAMNNGSTTTYTFTPTAGICATTQTMIITVNPIPSVVLQNGTICLDSAGVPISTHTFDTDLSDATYDFVWYDMATGLPIVPAEIGSTYVATAPGTYGVKITNTATTCSSGIISGVVGTLSAPQSYISIPTSNYFADVQTITVNVSPASGNYEYQIDNGGFQSSNVFTNVGSGTHTIEVRNECGSLPPREVNIVDFPRFFTPNGDGYHDTWNISALNNQSNAKIYIFDRFGKLLKEIKPSHNGWDGTFNGIDIPATDYWFVVYYEEDQANKEFKAHFALKR